MRTTTTTLAFAVLSIACGRSHGPAIEVAGRDELASPSTTIASDASPMPEARCAEEAPVLRWYDAGLTTSCATPGGPGIVVCDGSRCWCELEAPPFPRLGC